MSSKVGFLIVARLKSRRLPLKLLLRIAEKEIIRHVIYRAKNTYCVNNVILCTSTNNQDAPLARISLEENIYCYNGSGADVLQRMYEAAIFYGLDAFININADNPLFCIHHANRIADALRQNKEIDFVHIPELPIGSACYGLRTSTVGALCDIKKETNTGMWVPYVNRPDFFNVLKMEATPGYTFDARLTLDEPADYEFIHALHKEAKISISELDIPEIRKLLERKPELKEINSNVIQRTVPEDIAKAIDLLFLQDENLVRETINKYRV